MILKCCDTVVQRLTGAQMLILFWSEWWDNVIDTIYIYKKNNPLFHMPIDIENVFGWRTKQNYNQFEWTAIVADHLMKPIVISYKNIMFCHFQWKWTATQLLAMNQFFVWVYESEWVNCDENLIYNLEMQLFFLWKTIHSQTHWIQNSCLFIDNTPKFGAIGLNVQEKIVKML